MGFFSELEGNLEKYIESFFKDKFGSGDLQPVEIAKKLAREMRDRRRYGLKDVFVPNHFAIFLAPEDFASIEPLLDRFTAEMSEYIKNKALEKNYTMLGPVLVSFTEQQDLPRGELQINSFFDESVEAEQEQVEIEDTLRFVPVRGVSEPETVQKIGLLEAVEGTLIGRSFELSGNQVVIGRGENCDICLPDSSISRRHAVITRTGNQHLLSDRSSTNGTFINGVKIGRSELLDGDRIKMGNVVLIFKVE